jgi:hypothetical protein
MKLLVQGTPQQNGRVERKHRHILKVACALRFQANLPIEFWSECILTAGYVINRTPSLILYGKTPYEVLYGKTPQLRHMRVFGCYVHNQGHKGDKFASRSRKCVFMGYPYGKKGWRVYDLELGVFLISRDVVFCEDKFPYLTDGQQSPLSAHVDSTSGPIIDWVSMDDNEGPSTVPHSHMHENLVPHVGQEISRETGTDDNLEGNASILESSIVFPSDTVVVHDSSHETTYDKGGSSVVVNEEYLGRGQRTKIPSTRLQDFVTHTICTLSLSKSSSCSSESSGTPYPIAHCVNCDNFSAPYRHFLAAITAGTEPQTFAEAVKDERWRQAMKHKIHALEHNGTWTMKPLPPGKKAIGCKWVYRIKYNSDGSTERFKARLVILGNNQVEGLDYNETFAPIAKMVTVRTFLAVAAAAAKSWELHQMDVHNAFLHGDLEEEVYMKMPPGFRSPTLNQVCRLRKSLYGLRQAPRCWFAKLAGALKQYGFQQSHSDYSLFTLHKGTLQLHVLVYVDDLIISGNNSAAIHTFKHYLNTCFHMKDLGSLKYFLGIEVARYSTGLFLCQRKYAFDIISEVGILGVKPVAFPLDQNHHLPLADGPPLLDPDHYRRLVGRLIYLFVTRPELSYCVHMLAHFMQHPRQEHWEAPLCIVRYLKGNPGQ